MRAPDRNGRERAGVDRPMIFSASMVRALIREAEAPGTGKTQTRRVLKPQPYSFPHPNDGHRCWNASGAIGGLIAISDAHLAELHRYAAGDRLWVRETFSGPHEYEVEKWPPGAWFTGDPVWFWADGNPADGDWTKPKPPIHMPRWASRLTLLVSDVRVQRLQDISEGDARAEGVCQRADGMWSGHPDFAASDPVRAFAGLWECIHGAASFYDANPWIVVLTFSVVRANIDAIQPEPLS